MQPGHPGDVGEKRVVVGIAQLQFTRNKGTGADGAMRFGFFGLENYAFIHTLHICDFCLGHRVFLVLHIYIHRLSTTPPGGL